MNIRFPHRGYNKGLGAEVQPEHTTPWIQNMRVIDVQDNRFRGGQRPGLSKAYDQQISGVIMPVVELIQITTVD